jgi:hypothetical protein
MQAQMKQIKDSGLTNSESSEEEDYDVNYGANNVRALVYKPLFRYEEQYTEGDNLILKLVVAK